MKRLDRMLQRWRIAKARAYIPKGGTVLDIGCGDGALFRQLQTHIAAGVGIDLLLQDHEEVNGCRLIRGSFPKDVPDTGRFDAITMLAVLEHVPPQQQSELAVACMKFLKPGGHLVITVPSPIVDHILDVLMFIRLIDGQAVEQHYGFDPRQTPRIFSVGPMVLVESRKFQLGLNNLYVFRKAKA
jgi:2-polyprenyl-3-methyl-5-hydroxy-6-metoxy-1,4-benzoquinol methylase